MMKCSFGSALKSQDAFTHCVARLACVPVVLALSSLVGCAATGQEAANPDSPTFARKIIVEKVDSAVQSLRELAAVSQEGKQMVLRKQAALDNDAVDIDYAGKPQPLLESIAYRYGYKYIESGKRSDLKIINVRVEHARVLEVLKNIGLQIDQGADVILDRDAKIVRLIYKKS